MRHVGKETGSALILVLLISLVLSAFGIVALRDIAVGTQQSASFRTRTQAGMMSDSAVSAMAMRTGNKAEHYLSLVDRGSFGTEGATSTDAIYGVTGSGSGALGADRQAYATHGGFVVFQHDAFDSGGAGDLLPGQGGATAAYENESGLFTSGGHATDGFNSFESRDETSWQVILRNVSAGFPAPGYSNRYCFRRATLGASSQVGQISPTWNEPANVGRGIHAREIFLGPIPCGYN